MDSVDRQFSTCIMADKSMKLLDVLEKVESRKGEALPSHLYYFKTFENDKKLFGRKSETAIGGTQMLKYKDMNNANVFDMNTEIKNLPSFDLELVERPFGEVRLRRSTIRLNSKSIIIPNSVPVELKIPKNIEPKQEKEPIFEPLHNKFTAYSYDVFSIKI